MDFLPVDWTTRAIGGVLLFFGGMLIRTATSREKKSQQAQTWSQVHGEVLTSEVKLSPRNSKPRFRAAVLYRYTVNDETYENDTLFLGGRVATFKSKAEEIARKYPVGHQPTVYYDPSNPVDSYLLNQPQGLGAQKIVGAVVILVGLLIIFGYLPYK